MGKNPLDLHRKIRRYHQTVKILRRGLQIGITNLDTVQPDFALGTYQVKGNETYSLIINADLPKKGLGLRIDFWGLTVNNHLQHINQSHMNLSGRDAKVKFWTYPKTRHIFMTFYLEQDEEIDPDQYGKDKCNYIVNYLFLESKIPIPRSSDTPVIPNKIEFDYNIEIAPRLVMELEVDNILKDLPCPINFEIFEHEVLVYLLQKETDPEYLNILKKNMELCIIKSNGVPSQFRKVESSELIGLQNEIKKASRKLEEYMVRVDNLINHKHSLENMLDQPEDTIPYEKEQHESRIKMNQNMIEALNFKLNQVRKLQEANDQDIKGNEQDHRNMEEILNYYEVRILSDQQVFKEDLKKTEALFHTYQTKIVNPQSQKINQDQAQLDAVLGDYRKLRKKATILKEHLDEKIIKFLSLWYQYLIQENSLEY